MLKIVQYGDPVLRSKGATIEKIDDDVKALAEAMLETMYAANGVGLAAQQIGQALQLTVIDVADVEERPSRMWVAGEEVDLAEYMPMVLINPEITPHGDREVGVEGCLSFPDITADISRPGKVKVKATTLEGEALEFEADGLLSRAVQHEFDHLQGVLFIDRMNSATKVSLAGRLKRMAGRKGF